MGMLFHIVKKVGETEEEEAGTEMNKQIAKETMGKRKNLFKTKLAGLTKMNKMFGVLTTERDNILKIKRETHDGKLPKGLLMAGNAAVKNTASMFDKAMQLDA